MNPSHYLATECSTGRTYEVRRSFGISVGRPVEGKARGPVRIVRFRLECGSVVQMWAEVQDLQTKTTQP